MDVETLRNEYKSLAAEFPELRHAVVVRNATEHETNGQDIDRSDAVIRRMGLTVIHRQYLKTDLRSHIFAVWGGSIDQRADEANERFDGLAGHAVKLIPLLEIPGAIVPLGTRTTFTSSGGIAIHAPAESPTHSWVAHLIATQVNNPHAYTADGHNGNVYLLPWGSFHASALALPDTGTDSDDGLITIDEIAALACVAPKTVRQTAVASRPAFAVEPAGRTPGKFRYSEIRRWAVEQWPARSSEFPETFAEAQTKLGAAAKP